MNESMSAVVFDCSDAAKLAQFWSATLNKPIDSDASADFLTRTRIAPLVPATSEERPCRPGRPDRGSRLIH